MKKKLLVAIGGLLTACSCQTEPLNIQRNFPFTLLLDAFPTTIARHQPTVVGFGVRPDYVTAGNAYSFSWQLAAPNRGRLLLDNKVVETGQKMLMQPSTSSLLADSLTYIPADSGQHQITLRVVDGAGQRKDTTFTLTVQ